MRCHHRIFASGIVLGTMLACAPAQDAGTKKGSAPIGAVSADTLDPALTFHTCGRVTLGDPRAVTVDFGGVVVVADASPPRLVSYRPDTEQCQEFQAPADRPAFRPSGVAVRGFFVYAVDESAGIRAAPTATFFSTSKI